MGFGDFGRGMLRVSGSSVSFLWVLAVFIRRQQVRESVCGGGGGAKCSQIAEERIPVCEVVKTVRGLGFRYPNLNLAPWSTCGSKAHTRLIHVKGVLISKP